MADTVSGSPTNGALPISLSIVVPCYNEEEGLEPTVRGLMESLAGVIADYEIIVINDKSSDRTAEIADRLAREIPKVRVHHNEVNIGLGFNYRKGFQLATKEYVILVPGDNELQPDSVKYICGFAGRADIIVSYPENFRIRPLVRRIASTGFTGIVNGISGNNLRYYNGTVLQRRDNLLKVASVTNGFAFQAEILLQQLRAGATYHEVPFQLNFSSKRMTAFRLKNVVSVVSTLVRLGVRHRLR